MFNTPLLVKESDKFKLRIFRGEKKKEEGSPTSKYTYKYRGFTTKRLLTLRGSKAS